MSFSLFEESTVVVVAVDKHSFTWFHDPKSRRVPKVKKIGIFALNGCFGSISLFRPLSRIGQNDFYLVRFE